MRSLDQLLVGIAPVTNSDNVDDPLIVVHFINDAVVANANPPQVLGTNALSRPRPSAS